jgi:hypothetical protein
MDLTYGTHKKLADGRYYVKVSKPDSTRFMVQLNRVKLLTRFDESDDVTLELNQSSLDKISEIDAHNIASAKVNCQEWFGKAVADKTLETAYTKSLQEFTMNTTKARAGSQVLTKFFGHDKTPVESSALDVGLTCDIILEFSGIWFMQKTFGPIWRIAQVRLLAPPKKLYPDEYLFQDEEGEGEAVPEPDEDYI